MLNLDRTYVTLLVWTYGRSDYVLDVPVDAFVNNYYGAVIATLA